MNSSSTRNTAALVGAAGLSNHQPSSSGSQYRDGRRNSLSSVGGAPSTSAESYQLRTRNGNESINRAEAPPLPRKGLLAHGDEYGTMGSDGTDRRVLQHADAGPLELNAGTQEEEVDELPPQYGGWSGQQPQVHELITTQPPVENLSPVQISSESSSQQRQPQQQEIDSRGDEEDASMFYHSERPQYNHRF